LFYFTFAKVFEVELKDNTVDVAFYGVLYSIDVVYKTEWAVVHK